MPVDLSHNASWPSNHGIEPNWIGKWRYNHIRSRSLSSCDCCVHVVDQISCSLSAEGSWNWRHESEQCHCSRRDLQYLGPCQTRCWCHPDYRLFGARSAEGAKETSDECIDISRRY